MRNSSSGEKKNWRKNVSWLFGGEVGGSLFAACEAVVLARLLGLEQLGLFSIVVAYVKIVNGLADFKINEVVVKYAGGCLERRDKAGTLSFVKLFYLIDFLSGVAAFAAVLFLAGFAGEYFIKSETSGNAFELVLIYSFSLLVSTVNTNSRAVLESCKKFNSIAFADTLGVVLRFVFVFASLVAGFGIKGALFAYVAAAFAGFSVLQFLVRRALRDEGLGGWFSASLGPALSEMRGVVSFVLSSTFTGFFSRVFERNFPMLVLGHFAGNEASGLYKTAVIFSKVVGKLRTPAQRAIYPALVRLEERGSYESFRQVVSYSVGFLLKFFIPVGALFFVFADEIIGVFFGAEYLPAANAMRIVVVAQVLSGFSFWINAVYLALGRVWFRTGLASVSALSYSVALFYLVPAYSFEGAALATLVPCLFLLPAAVLLFRHIRERSAEERV